MAKVNPTVALHVTARELVVLRRAIPYGTWGTLADKLAQAEKDSRVAVREARRELKKRELTGD